MIKRISYLILGPMAEIYYKLKYRNNFWFKLKNQLAEESSLGAFVYYRFLDKKGSWIGFNSKIESIPCFPHGINGVFISGGGRKLERTV